MPSWKRITLVVFVLIGGTMAFGYWSFSQFNNVFDDLSASFVVNTLTVSSSLEKDTKLASTSLEILGVLATSTSSFDNTQDKSPQATTPATPNQDSSGSSGTGQAVTSIDLELSFTFPKKGDEVYVGCTYPISWQSSTTINSLGTILVDAGAREVIDPITSGLAKESVIETDSQNLNWKVGFVWPGAYYIKVLKINGADVEIRSKVFTINNMPKGINTDEREKICKKSGSLF